MIDTLGECGCCNPAMPCHMARVTAYARLGGPAPFAPYLRGRWVYGDGSLNEDARLAMGQVFVDNVTPELMWGRLYDGDPGQSKRAGRVVYRRAGNGSGDGWSQILDAGEEATFDHQTCDCTEWRKYYADSYTDGGGTATSTWERNLNGTSGQNIGLGALPSIGSVADTQWAIDQQILSGSAKAVMDCTETAATLRISIHVTGAYTQDWEATYTLQCFTLKTFDEAVKEAQDMCDMIPLANITSTPIEWNKGTYAGQTTVLGWDAEAWVWYANEGAGKTLFRKKEGLILGQIQLPTFERSIQLGSPQTNWDWPPITTWHTVVTESRLRLDDAGNSAQGHRNCLVKREYTPPSPNSSITADDGFGDFDPVLTGNERCHPAFNEGDFEVDWTVSVEFPWGTGTVYWRCGYITLPDLYQRLCAWDGPFTFDRTNQSFDTTGHTFDERPI